MTENPQQQGAPTPGGHQAQGQQPYGATQQEPYPAPGQQDSKYGTAAYNPGAVGQETGEPKGWARLKTLTLASFGLHLVSGILGFAGLNEDMLRETAAAELEAQGLAASDEMIEQSVQLGMALGMGTMIVSIVLGIILYLLVFFGLRGGKNWARILGTVLAAIGTLYTLVGLAGIGVALSISPVMGTITLILSVLFVAVNIWWIVTAFSKDVNAYVRMRSGR
jgi:amino acid transporter